MKDKQIHHFFQQALNDELSALRTSSVQRTELYQNAVGGYKVKKKLTVGWVLALALMLFAVTAAAAALLTHTQIIEQFAVPMALKNDTNNAIQEVYSNQELDQIVSILSENDLALDENSSIMKALKQGKGYWEEETLMAICREAFGGLFYEWSIEQKYWFETMAVQIGFKENNPFLLPAQGDMTIPQATAYAVKLLNNEYGIELPTEKNSDWDIREWFYGPWTDSDGDHQAYWQFEFVNRKTGITAYTARFDRDGRQVVLEGLPPHTAHIQAASFDEATMYIDEKYGAMGDWSLAGWAEFGQLIEPFRPENQRQWAHQQAGYRLPPDGSLSESQALHIAREAIQMGDEDSSQIICCVSNGKPLYKLTLRYEFPEDRIEHLYDAVWCVEMDCATGEITAMRPHYANHTTQYLELFVPFELLENLPVFQND
ncbi:MAG: hypothetical protein IJF65_01810 [Clostridia bacterium]|nr:hypothetical protein [Clostridia bacterium]